MTCIYNINNKHDEYYKAIDNKEKINDKPITEFK